MARTHVVVLGLILLTVPLVGCTNPQAPGNTTSGNATGATPGGSSGDTTYTHADIGEPRTLDPAIDWETSGGTVIQQVYETLLWYDGTSTTELEPKLAASMPEVSDNGTVYTFELREDVTFHDGTEMTAEDVKFSLDRIVLMDNPNGPAGIYRPIKGAATYFDSNGTLEDRETYLEAGGVQVVDEHTVEIRLDEANPSFPFRLTFQGASVVSKDAVCQHAPDAWTEEASGIGCIPPPGETKDPWMAEHMVGTGPFEFEQWQQGQFVELSKNEDYWGEPADLDRVFIQKVEDINTRVLMLKDDDADSIYVPEDQLGQVQDVSGIQIEENPSLSVAFLGFNFKFCGGPNATDFDSCMDQHGDAVPEGADGEPDPLFFQDEHMRKAWSLAFDYETYFQEIANGHGRLLNGALPKGIVGYDASIPTPSQDVEEAKEQLAKSDHPDGFQATIYYNTGNTVREKAAALLAKNLEALGPDKIDVETQGLSWSSAYLPKLDAKALPAFFLGWLADYAYPDNFLVNFAHSEQGLYAPRMSYENPDLDATLEDAMSATDPDRAEELWTEGVRQLNEDHAFLWLRQSSDIFVAQDDVEGYYHNPMYSGITSGPGDYSTLRLADA